MDRSAAVRELPTLHAVAIRLQDGGLDDHVIAVALELEDDEVPQVLRVARSKLAALLGQTSLDAASAPPGPHEAPGQKPRDHGSERAHHSRK